MLILCKKCGYTDFPIYFILTKLQIPGDYYNKGKILGGLIIDNVIIV